MKHFYSNGKLLITGEYLVLDGAKALALPTKMGQTLTIDDGTNKKVYWTSFDADGNIWFEEHLTFDTIKENKKSETEPIKTILQNILHQADILNPNIFANSEGFIVTTHLSFPRNWGLGTSSTLINNIAQWFQIDAFTLLKNSFGGSGYDIACAQNNTPILYHLEKGKPIIENISFTPSFYKHIFFVYLNKKQDSKKQIIQYYQNKNSHLAANITAITTLTQAVIAANTSNECIKVIEKHEALLSTILKTPTIKETLFPDFEGGIKSLGAWGGDFVLVVTPSDPSNYFISKGYSTIIPYSEMIL